LLLPDFWGWQVSEHNVANLVDDVVILALTMLRKDAEPCSLETFLADERSINVSWDVVIPCRRRKLGFARPQLGHD
jgi:hypothetical protein